MLNPYRILRDQLNASDDAIPVAVGVLSQRAGHLADIVEVPVVYANCEAIGARLCRVPERITVGRAQAFLTPQQGPIQPDVRAPMAPLEEQLHPLPAPCLRNDDVP